MPDGNNNIIRKRQAESLKISSRRDFNLWHVFRNKTLDSLRIFSWLSKLFFLWSYAELNYFNNKIRPLRLMIKITNNCNYQCNICGIWNNEDKKYLSIEDQNTIFNKYGQNLFFLTITGGEPFLDEKYLISLITLAKQRCPNLYMVSINTNGYFTENILYSINFLLQKYSFLRIYIGLNYIVDDKWGGKRTNNKESFLKSRETLRGLLNLQRIFKSRLHFYNIFTIDDSKDVEIANNLNEEVWINFSELDDFYDNSQYSGIGKLTTQERNILVDRYLQKKGLSILNLAYLLFLRNILSNKKRNIRCFAGKNRIYINCYGREYICCRCVGAEQDEKKCAICWTPCEAVFDIIQHPFTFIILYCQWKSAQVKI
jgi:MoaA/NifB/PqqE/SkfB family radical SAM enzyme